MTYPRTKQPNRLNNIASTHPLNKRMRKGEPNQLAERGVRLGARREKRSIGDALEKRNPNLSAIPNSWTLTTYIVPDAATDGVTAKPPTIPQQYWLNPYCIRISFKETLVGLACSMLPVGSCEACAVRCSMSIISVNLLRCRAGDSAFKLLHDTSISPPTGGTWSRFARCKLGTFFFMAVP